MQQLYHHHQIDTDVWLHHDVTKWKHCPRYWPFVRRIHQSPVHSLPNGQWRGTLMFSFIYAWISGWINTRDTGNLIHHRAHYDDTVISIMYTPADENSNAISQYDAILQAIHMDEFVEKIYIRGTKIKKLLCWKLLQDQHRRAMKLFSVLWFIININTEFNMADRIWFKTDVWASLWNQPVFGSLLISAIIFVNINPGGEIREFLVVFLFDQSNYINSLTAAAFMSDQTAFLVLWWIDWMTWVTLFPFSIF